MSHQYNTLFGYLTLLQLIPRAPGYRAIPTLQALLEERGLQVDRRSVRHDLEKMSNKLPLLCDKSQKSYRWSFDPAFDSNLHAFETPTVLTLVLAEKYLKGLFPEAAIVQLNNKFTAARKYLEQLKESGFSDWMQHVKAIPNGKALIPVPINSAIWAEVTDALLKDLALDVTYLSRVKGKEKHLTLHPLGLVARHSVTYLLATVDDYKDIRQFSLHRIKQIKQSLAVYQAQSDLDIDEYIKKGVFGYRLGEKNIELVAKIRPKIAWLLSKTSASGQQSLSESDDEGWVILKEIVPDEFQTQWWVMGFGEQIDVLGPRRFKNKIINIDEDTQNIYKKNL